MIIRSAKFLSSAVKISDMPKPTKPEYAFIGRSNVGKSSLINTLTNNGMLAKVSSRPGKTQTINHYLINEQWLLADMPGYGWAKVGKSLKTQFSEINKKYFHERTNLMCAMVLIDSRLPPQANDKEFVQWLGRLEIPFVLIFTKTDKHSVNKAQAHVSSFKKWMLEYWEELPPIFLCSAYTGYGRDKILEFIDNSNQKFEQPKE